MIGRCRYLLCLVAALGVISTSVWGEAVTLLDLEGTVVEVRSKRAQQVRRKGREFSNQLESELRIEFKAGGTTHIAIASTTYGKGGVRKGKARSGMWTLDQARTLKSHGGGHGVWLFENGTLTNLRTYQGGALKRTITFAQGSNGLSCRATESMAREDGVTCLILAGSDGRPSQILSFKQISSTCRVTKPDQAKAR
jgi:hypothetical protein